MISHVKIKGSVLLLSLCAAVSLLFLSAQRSEAKSKVQAIDTSFCGLSQNNSASDLKKLKQKYPTHPGFHYQWGQYQSCQSNVSEAIAAYQQAIALDPKFAHAYLELGKLHEAQEHWEQAIATYQKVIDIDPNLGEAYPHLAAIYTRQNRTQEAEATLQKALPEVFSSPFLARYSDPGYLEAKADLKQGQQFLAQGQLLKAEPLLRKAVSLNPSNSDASQALGTLFVQKNQPDDAIETVRQTAFYILKRNKDVDLFLTPEVVEMTASVESHAWVAQQYVEQGDLTTAIDVLKKSLKRLDQKTQLLSAPAPSGENSPSRNTLDRFRRQLPIQIGQLLVQQGNEKDAFEQLKTDDSFRQNVLAKVDQIASDSVQNESRIQSTAYEQIGDAYLAQDRISKAIAAYQKAVQLNPNNRNAFSALGRAHLILNHSYAALNTYKKLVAKRKEKLDSTQIDGTAIQLAAAELIRLQDLDRAIELLQSGLKLALSKTQKLEIKMALKTVFLQQQNYQQAASILQEIIAEKPENALILMSNLVDLQIKMAKFSQAELTAKAIIAQFPGEYESGIKLGQVYSHQNRIDLALTSLYRGSSGRGPIEFDLDKVFDIDPLGEEIARLKLAKYLKSQGKFEEALAQYQRWKEVKTSTQSDPRDSQEIAELYVLLNRSAEAIPLLQDILAVNTAYDNFSYRNGMHLLLAKAYTHEGHYQKALAAYRLTREGPGLDGVVFATYPSMSRDVFFYSNLGYVLSELEHTDLALETLTLAIQLQPDEAYPRYLRGNMYQEQAQFDQALQDYQVAIANIPDNYKPGLTKTSLFLYPTLSEMYLSWGKILLQQDQPAQAQEKFEQALQTNPENTEAKSLLNSISPN